MAVGGDRPVRLSWRKIDDSNPCPAGASAEECAGAPLSSTTFVRRGVIEFRSIAVSDAGRYVCTGDNTAGTAQAIAEVVVQGEWVFDGGCEKKLYMFVLS